MPAVPARGPCASPHVFLNLLLLLVHLSKSEQKKSPMVTAGTVMGRLLQGHSCVLPISKNVEGSTVCDKCFWQSQECSQHQPSESARQILMKQGEFFCGHLNIFFLPWSGIPCSCSYCLSINWRLDQM